MTDTVLDRGRQFTESLVVSLRNEDRVIAETALPVFFFGDPSAYNPAHRKSISIRLYERDHGSKLRATVGLSLQFMQSLGTVSRRFSCPTGGIDTGLAIQRIDLQTRIVCEHTVYCPLSIVQYPIINGLRFDGTVLLQSRTRLVYLVLKTDLVQTQYLHSGRHDLTNLRQLMRIIGCKNQFHSYLFKNRRKDTKKFAYMQDFL